MSKCLACKVCLVFWWAAVGGIYNSPESLEPAEPPNPQGRSSLAPLKSLDSL